MGVKICIVDIKRRVLILSAFLLIFSNIIFAQQLKIYCIDVNTGSSTLIVSPANKYILIDAGEYTNFYGDTVLNYIRSLGITHLDYTVATHYHSDHIGGMPRVINGLSGGGGNDSILQWCYDRGDTYTTYQYTNYKNAVAGKRRTIALGETIDLSGGVKMVCIVSNGKIVNGDSVASLPPDNENYRSIGFVLTFGTFKFWVGGDLTGTGGERDVESKVAPIVRKVDVYVTNHHGSTNSSCETFLDSLRPEAAIISQGVDPTNNGHPHQGCLDRLIAHNTYIYQMNANPSGGTFDTLTQGRILNTTAAITVNTYNYIINGDTYQLSGVRRDGYCQQISEPTDTIPEGTIVTLKALIKNLGNITDSFLARFKIGSVYNRIKSISSLAPNDTITAIFDTTWSSIRGNYLVSCSTEVPRDTNRTNDKKYLNLTVAYYDAELKDILIPIANDTFLTTESIAPKVIVKDNSQYSYSTLAKIYCLIKGTSTIYSDSIQHLLIPGGTDTFTFTKKPLTGVNQGNYVCSTWVTRINDMNPSNNKKSRQFYIKTPPTTNPGWEDLGQSRNIPQLKGVKGGGSLVTVIDGDIYALKGNNTKEFYMYDISVENWNTKETIPNVSASIRKRVNKGGALTYNNFTNTIYATKGNNTLEFWAYDIANDSWFNRTQVPTGLKRVKGGASLAFLKRGSQHYVYLLKGNNTNEFYGYHCQADTWMKSLEQAPLGSDGRKYKDGSCIVAGPNDRIYVLKGGAKLNEFYAYDAADDTWYTLESIPKYNGITRKKTKVKDGAALCYDGDNLIYAFKGGNQEFWVYDITQDQWSELDTIRKLPDGKKVGSGGSLAYADNKVYALKGNGTRYLWCYTPLSNEAKSDNTGTNNIVPIATINKNSVIRNSLPAIIKAFNSSGQLVKTQVIQNYSLENLSNILSGVKSGIYFIQINPLSKETQQFTQKIVIPETK